MERECVEDHSPLFTQRGRLTVKQASRLRHTRAPAIECALVSVNDGSGVSTQRVRATTSPPTRGARVRRRPLATFLSQRARHTAKQASRLRHTRAPAIGAYS